MRDDERRFHHDDQACNVAKFWRERTRRAADGARSQRDLGRAAAGSEDGGRARPPADHHHRQASARRVRQADRALVAGRQRPRARRARLRLDRAAARQLADDPRRGDRGRVARRRLAQPRHDQPRPPFDRGGQQMALVLPVGLRAIRSTRTSRAVPRRRRSSRRSPASTAPSSRSSRPARTSPSIAASPRG